MPNIAFSKPKGVSAVNRQESGSVLTYSSQLEEILASADEGWKTKNFDDKAYQTLRETLIEEFKDREDFGSEISQEFWDILTNNHLLED